MRLFFVVAVLCSAASPAQAFPIAGAASMASVAAAFIAGAGGIARSVRTASLAARVGALVAVLAVAFLAGWMSSARNTGLEAGLALRWGQPSEGIWVDVARPVPGSGAPVRAVDIAFLEDNDLLVSPAAWGRGDLPGFELAYIDARPDESFQPYRIARFGPGEAAAVTSWLAARDGRGILIAETPARLAEALRRARAAGLTAARGMVFGTIDWKMPRLADAPMRSPGADAFAYRAFELSPPPIVAGRGTLVNAGSLSLYDMLLMRDAALRDLVRAGDRPVLVADYHADRYGLADRRLRAAGLVPGLDYVFLEGGLGAFFANHTLTPTYFNDRLVRPERLARWAVLTDRVRVICSVPRRCLDTLPESVRIDLPADLPRAARAAAVKALPEGVIYTAVATDRVTMRNAIEIGYWLNEAGRNYAGHMGGHERFVPFLEQRRAQEAFDETVSLETWRQANGLLVGVVETARQAVSEFGWVGALAALGAVLRLLVLPLERVGAATRAWPAGPSPALLVGPLAVMALLAASCGVIWIGIHDLALVPSPVMTELVRTPPAWPAAGLAAVLALRLITLSPAWRPGLAAGLALGLAWALGLFEALLDPIAVFVAGFEAVAVLAALPGLWRDQAARRAARAGYHLDPAHPPCDPPGKWHLTCRIFPQVGLLVDLDRAPIAAAAARIGRLKAERVILRSAAGDALEQGRAGIHDSPVVRNTQDDIAAGLRRQADSGLTRVWAQPAHSAGAFGVIASVGKCARRGVGAFGPGRAATEGARPAREVCLDTQASRWRRRALWRALRRAERATGGPVILEVSAARPDMTGRVRVHQVRRMAPDHHPEAVLFPAGRTGLDLAEDIRARPEPLTGQIFAWASRGDLVFLGGVLYRRRRHRIAWPCVSCRGLRALERDLTAWLAQAPPDAGAPAEIVARAGAGLDLIARIYAMSQARVRPRQVETALGHVRLIESGIGDELDAARDVAVERASLAEIRQGGPAEAMAPRDALHRALVLSIAGMAELVRAVRAEKGGRTAIRLPDLVGKEKLEGGMFFDAARAPLPRHALLASHAGRRIVPGPIRGPLWEVAEGCLPVRGARVLVGEEIGAEWAAHLDAFSGIVSVYGHERSHLALTAAARGIPYAKVSREVLDRLRAAHAARGPAGRDPSMRRAR